MLLLAPQMASAGPVAASAPDNVAVTVYRDPYRGAGAMDRRWPRGYAFITETRTLRLPAGESVIRFEGVAEGMLPESAIVTGFPRGVREKNRDARLISPSGLVDAFLKRRVMLSRTNRATGRVTRQEAVIQAGPNGGVLVESAQGVEALGCSGLPERMIYPGIPGDLSAKPTLSVLATSDRAVTATVTLSYLAQGFDWQANYVARMADDGKSFGLFAWLTVANGGISGFPDSQLQVVAGQPRRQAAAPPLAQRDPALHLRCWPLDITSTHPRLVWGRLPWPLDGSQWEAISVDAFDSDLIVTAGKVRRSPGVMAMSAPPPPPSPPPPVMAEQEDLGDLKLYRVPVRVNVAAQSQKQVAMLEQSTAQFDRIYSAYLGSGSTRPSQLGIHLRSRNIKDRGLGLPLPAGMLALFEAVAENSLLAGELVFADKAVGEEVDLLIGTSPDVQWTLTQGFHNGERQVWRADVSNARPVPVRVEIIVPGDLVNRAPDIERGPGGWRLPLTVPAQDRTSLEFTVKLR